MHQFSQVATINGFSALPRFWGCLHVQLCLMIRTHHKGSPRTEPVSNFISSDTYLLCEPEQVSQPLRAQLQWPSIMGNNFPLNDYSLIAPQFPGHPLSPVPVTDSGCPGSPICFPAPAQCLTQDKSSTRACELDELVYPRASHPLQREHPEQGFGS